VWCTPTTLDLPRDYEVIGEHLTDPMRLLVVGEDGLLYALSLTDGQTEPTALHDGWVVDTCELHEKIHRIPPN